MRASSRYSKLLFFLLLTVSLGAWKGPMRDQDLKVYRLSMPVLLDATYAEPAGGGVPRWRVAKVLPQPQLGGSRDRFGIAVHFSRIPADGEGAGSHEVVKHYLVEPTGVQSVEVVTPSSLEVPSLGISFDSERAVLRVRGERYGYRSAFVAEPGAVSTAPVLSHFNALGEKEFLALETLGDSGQQFVTLVRLPSTQGQAANNQQEAPVREADGRPLVDLQSVGFPQEVGGLALMGDGKTLVLVAGDAFDHSQTGSRELWLIRLPGTLRASPVMVYVLSAVVVLLSLTLLIISLRRRSDSKQTQPANG